MSRAVADVLSGGSGNQILIGANTAIWNTEGSAVKASISKQHKGVDMLRVRAHVFSRHFILSAAAFMAIGLLTSCSSKKENTSPPNRETEVQSQAFKEDTQTAGRTSEEQEQKQDRALREEQLSAATKLIETFP